MRTRQIHADFWKSESIADLSPIERLLFIGLWGMADREGYVLRRELRIKAEIFPYDNLKRADMAKAIDALIEAELLELLEAEGQEYQCLHIVKFKEYQRCHEREAASKLADLYTTKATPRRHLGDAKATPGCSASASASASASEGDFIPGRAREILSHLCAVTGRNFTDTSKIEACLKRDKPSVDECKLVIDYKWREWSGTDFAKYVDNDTPWRPTKFKGYLDAAKAGPVAQPGHGPRFTNAADAEKAMMEEMLREMEAENAAGK